MRLLFLVNNPDFFLSHRLPIGLAAKEAGFDVHVATPRGHVEEKIRSFGFTFHTISMNRSRMVPWREIISLLSILKLYRRLKPDLVHHVTIKPVLYGTLAARWARVPAVCNAISGLGFIFLAQGLKAELIRGLVLRAYRFCAHHDNMKVILQNQDDRDHFLARNLFKAAECVLIPGSGVDINHFVPAPEMPGTPVVALAARLLWDKGINEFVEAARSLNAAGARARFVLVGEPDPGNPTSIPEPVLRQWAAEKVVELWGFRADMDRVFHEVHIVCLPSYREGLPKVMAEAAAAGKPLIVSDVPGCRDVVIPGENGLRVPVRDSVALATAIGELLADPAKRRRMGECSRQRAVSEYSEGKIVEMTLNVYRSLFPAEGA